MPEKFIPLESVNLKLVPATGKDADALIAYENTPGVTHPDTYEPLHSRDAAIKELNENVYYSIKAGRLIVGTASFRNWIEGGTYIGNLTVAPSHRRTGIAKAAIQKIIELNPHSKTFTLFTHPDNTPAQTLYRSLGFENRGLAKPPFPSKVDFVKMVKRVIPPV